MLSVGESLEEEWNIGMILTCLPQNVYECGNYSGNSISQVMPVVKSLPAKARFNPWVWKSPGRGHGNPFQYSGWENPMDRGAKPATVHRVGRAGHN